MDSPRTRSIVGSALWAAYGDALGFITELTDETGVRRRAKSSFVRTTVPWVRMIGGKFGAQVPLPAGCYSDDTQLRLATSRAIRGDGSFDVVAFAKVELPVFDAYSLGAGFSTKAAAQSLANSSVNWFSNFFKKGAIDYLNGGGNGSVMRIQPHVWCEKGVLSVETAAKIVRNTVCTHGHPKALVGAIFHAQHLSIAITQGELLHPVEWLNASREFEEIPRLIRSDSELSMVWLPTWEAKTGKSWSASWDESYRELRSFIETAVAVTRTDDAPERKYLKLVSKLSASDESVRGEAMRTAVLSLFLAWEYRDHKPADAISVAANALRTDTDTIATLVGALMGAIHRTVPEGDVLDRRYIEAEAKRLAAISEGRRADTFQYPNLLTWRPPRSQMDVVSLMNGRTYVAGLGPVEQPGAVYAGRKGGELWQILVLNIGQTLIAKRREMLPAFQDAQFELPAGEQLPEISYNALVEAPAPKIVPKAPQQIPTSKVATVDKNQNQNLDSITDELIANGFPAYEIGMKLLSFADRDDAVESATAFAAIVVKARRARIKRSRNSA